MRLMALSVRQPWATLIVEGVKDIENRTWPTRRRGPLLIHAPQNYDDVHAYAHLYGKSKDFVCGAIIGMVDLVGCVTDHESEWFEGPYGFVFENPRKFRDPILCRGQLRFFPVDLNEVSPGAIRICI
jgi:hypothetical protein